ncbi:MAG: RNA methyltransferase [Acidothermales bacterium]|jgi:TrmH family RNA methyltransferase|nr:RNA methyltransferase [Acidothermales bacterium]
MAGRELTDPRAPAVRAARRLLKRSFRELDGRFLAEGPQAVREAARQPGVLLELYVSAPAADRHPELVAAVAAAGVPVHQASGEVLAALSDTTTPQGVVGVCRRIDVDLSEVTSRSPRLVVVLADVRDPGNAGTVIRTADAAGADAVVLAGGSVDPYNGKCVRATAGSLFHLAVVTAVRILDAVAALRGGGLQVLAADGRAETDLDAALESGGLIAPTAWLFGNEAWGLPEETVAAADRAVRVPIHGAAESLNLAAAAAVCLYASAGAQRAGITAAERVRNSTVSPGYPVHRVREGGSR